MKVVRHQLRPDREQPLEVRDALDERAQRLVVAEVADVVGDPRPPAPGQAEGALQLGAAGQQRPGRAARKRDARGDVAARAAQERRPPCHHRAPPSHRFASRSGGRAGGTGRRSGAGAPARRRPGRRSARRADVAARQDQRHSRLGRAAGDAAPSRAASRRARVHRRRRSMPPRPPRAGGRARSDAPAPAAARARVCPDGRDRRRRPGPWPSARTAAPHGACARAARPPPARDRRGRPDGSRPGPSRPRSRPRAARPPPRPTDPCVPPGPLRSQCGAAGRCGGVQPQRRTALRAGVRLGVEAAVQRVLVLAPGSAAHIAKAAIVVSGRS